MQKLADTIQEALNRSEHYMIPSEELNRIWPDHSALAKEQKLREFAEKHGWNIFSYHPVTGAYFVRRR